MIFEIILLCLIAYIVIYVIETNKHIDNLYEEIEWLKREIQFQDEWIELDIDLDE